MNFVGHAVVAGWRSDAPRFALGAMLPDFASMCGARLLGAGDAEVADGIAHHHRTDDAFHGAPGFLRFSERGAEELMAAGLSRGPARAVAHVGAELVIDGLLLDEGHHRATYLGAIAATGERLGLRFRDDGAERFGSIAARLRALGVPDDYRRPEGVQRRLGQALARRPRLRPAPGDADAIHAWLVATRSELTSSLPELLSQVRARLTREP